MTALWHPLRDELALWRRAGLSLPLWWRDDDAVTVTPALEQLLDLARDLQLPVHLAVIPKPATEALAAACAASDWVLPMVHGWAHENHAPPGQKKAEFNHPRANALAETAQGLARLQELFGAQLVPMFVPPWNRIDGAVVAGLHAQGYLGLSTFTPRGSVHSHGLVQINTHTDPIHWKAGGGLVQPEQILSALVATLQDRRTGRTDAAEPLGFLTHHLVHDRAIWDFTARCLSELLQGGAAPVFLNQTKELA